VLEPTSRRLLKVIGLWRLVVSEPDSNVLEAAQAQAPIAVSAWTDREEVARLLSKYNLLAVPVVADGGEVLGIVTVDDVIDAIIAEGTEDVQKFGGSQALEEAYVSVDFVTMIRKRAGWLCALFLSEMLTASAMQAYQGEIERAVVLTSSFHSL
jgi:magnesium transporter